LATHFEPIGARRSRPRGVDHRTVEQMADERAKQRTLFDGGFAAITWPVEYGGRGLSHDHEAAFLQQAAGYRMPDLGVVGGTTYGVCANTMLRHASPEFLRRHGPAMFAGDELWCQLFSEPSAGSDLAGITTRATRDGDRWRLTGSKVWSSGALYADYGMCLARTNWEVPKHRGLTWFAVKLDAKGVEIQPIREINGDTEFCQEFLDDVELTDDDVIGEVDQGWSVAQTMLVFERGAGTPASAVMATPPQGLAPDLVALAQRVGRERDPVVRQLIAKAHTNAYVHGQLARRIAQHLRIDPSAAAGIASYGKLAAGTFLPIRARIGMEIGGPAALLWNDDDVEEQRASLDHLNSRIMSIAGGTNEMQRNAIGERVLGLPREPSFDTNKPFREVLRDAADWK
jgi:alkylation response protein AidB-like acyl-CoA dehydrogenase